MNYIVFFNLKQDGASDCAASPDLDPPLLSGTTSCYISALSAATTFTLLRQRGHIRPNEIQEPTAQLETSNPLPPVSQASKKSNWIRINVRVRLPSLQNKSPMGCCFFVLFWVFFVAALCVTAVIHPQERTNTTDTLSSFQNLQEMIR